MTSKHRNYLTFAKDQLEGMHGFKVVKAYIVPHNESVLRKKFNGALPLEDDERMLALEAEIS